MQKIILSNLMEDIVKEVAAAHGLDEGEARALVVIAIKKNRDAFKSAVQAPKLVLEGQATA